MEVTFSSRTPAFHPSDRLVAALQTYADLVAYHWDRPTSRLVWYSSENVPLSPERALVVYQMCSSRPDLLGQHRVVGGIVSGEVYLDHATKALVPLSVVLAHELAEMIVNPYGNLCVADQDYKAWALEVCDPVEADWIYLPEYPNIPLSNFVLPDFYRTGTIPEKSRYSLDGKVSRAFTLRPGGYRQVLVPGVGWRREMARKES